MDGITTLDMNNKVEVIGFLSRLSELVKCTLEVFNLGYKTDKEFVVTKIFAFRFASFLPTKHNRLDELSYEEIFIGENSIILTSIYKHLLDVFFQIEDFRMLPTSEPQMGYTKIESELRQIDNELDSLIKRIKKGFEGKFSKTV